MVTGGQRNDGAVLEQVLTDIRVPRRGRGEPPTRPDAALADKAYAAGTTRRMLQHRGSKVVIPIKSDQIAARQLKVSKSGATTRPGGPHGPGSQRCRAFLRFD